MDDNDSIPKEPFSWSFWFIVILLTLGLTVLNAPMFIRPRGHHHGQTEGISNLRQLGLALSEFENEYGFYPNESTSALVTKKNPDHGYDLSGTSSNALFRQLFAAEMIQSEDIFHSDIPGIRKPDDDFSQGKALEKGEVAFGYVAGLSTEGNPARPIAFCPIIPGTDRFDPEPFDGKAIVLRIDNSVSSIRIDKDGHAITDRKPLFETGADTVWGDVNPDIRYPELPAPEKPSFWKKLFSN